MNTKICIKCGLEKNFSKFRKDKRIKNGLTSICLDCYGKYKKEYDKQYRKTDSYKSSQARYRQSEKYLKHLSIRNKKDSYKKRRNDYFRERKNIDIKFRLDRNIASTISISLKGKKAGRTWESLVGYTIEDLIKHLESKFEFWMSWSNYGKWHIDHIKPKSLFHYTCPEDQEFKECWALSNLQPMEAKENIKKSNKFI